MRVQNYTLMSENPNNYQFLTLRTTNNDDYITTTNFAYSTKFFYADMLFKRSAGFAKLAERRTLSSAAVANSTLSTLIRLRCEPFFL